MLKSALEEVGHCQLVLQFIFFGILFLVGGLLAKANCVFLFHL